MPPVTTFGTTFASLAPLAPYVERAGLLGDVHSELGPSLSRFLSGVNTASSPIFRHLGSEIGSSLESLDPAVRLGGLRRFQLALQFSERDSDVLREMTRELEDPDRIELKMELEKESERLGEKIRRHDKGLLGDILVRLPFFRSDDDLVQLSQKGNLQALRRAIDRDLFEKTLEGGFYSHPLYPDMIVWFAISEYFAKEPPSSPKFDKAVLRDVRLVVDGFFMSALKLHRGKDLLRLHRILVAKDPDTHEFKMMRGEIPTGYEPEHYSRWSLSRLRQWTEHWVEALKRFDRRIDSSEGLETAQAGIPGIFTDTALANLTEIAAERFEETAAMVSSTARSETVSRARMILNTLNSRRRAEPSARPPARTTSSSSSRPAVAPPLTVSVIDPGPAIDPARLGEHPIFLTIGRWGQTAVPLPLANDQELIIAADAADPSSPALRLKYHGELFQVLEATAGVHLEEGGGKRPLAKKDWINFGAVLSVAGYIVRVLKPARPIEL